MEKNIKSENKAEKKPEQKAETAKIRSIKAKAEKKKRIAETVQIGNTGFNKEAIINMSWDDFQAHYTGKLKRISVKAAFKKLGGKMNTK